VFDPGEVGPALRLLRQREGLSCAELARRAGLRRQTVSNYERGEYVPALPTLAAILTVLEASLCELQRAMEGEG
jgi:transcriptional regulator with XRE-family HTH domain